MLTVATALCLTLLHSIWQSALLLGAWKISGMLFRNRTPLASRNVLYGFITVQLILSVITALVLIYQPRWSAVMVLPWSEWAIPFDTYLLWIYAVVVAWRLITLWYGYITLHRGARQYMKPPVHLRLYTGERAREMGIRRTVRLHLVQQIQSPMTYGFFKPVILLPVAMVNSMSVRDIEMILLHELSHIRYKDYLLNMYLLVVQQLYFFNPFFRVMAEKIKLERELNCDQRVLQYRYPAEEYAEALLKTAMLRKQFAWQLAAVSEKHELLRRIRYFATPRKEPKNNGFLICCSTLMLCCAALLIAVVSLKQSAPVSIPAIAQKVVQDNGLIYLTGSPALHEQTTPEIRTSVPVIKPKKNGTVQVKPAITPVQELTAAIAPDEMPEANPVIYLPVNLQHLPQKQVTITEVDASTGKSTVQSIRLVFINEEWVMIPEWQMESYPAADTTPVQLPHPEQ